MGIVNKKSESYIRRSGDAKKALDQVAKNLENIINGIELITEDTLDEIALKDKKRPYEIVVVDLIPIGIRTDVNAEFILHQH